MARKKGKGRGWHGDEEGHRLAAKGKKVPWAERHKTKPGPTPQLSKTDVHNIHAARSDRAKAMDEGIQAETVLDITCPEDRIKWAQDPAQLDIEGIDTAIEELDDVGAELQAQQQAAEEMEEGLKQLKDEVKDQTDELEDEAIEEATEQIKETKEEIREQQEKTADKQAELEEIKAKKVPEDWEDVNMKKRKDTLMDKSIDNPIIAMNLARLHRNAKRKQPDRVKDFDRVVWEQVITDKIDPTKDWPTLTERAKDEFHIDPDERVQAIYKDEDPPEMSEAAYEKAMDEQTRYIKNELGVDKTKAQKIAQGEADPLDFMSQAELERRTA